MTTARNSRILRTIPLLIALFALSPVRGQAQDGRPVADAGSSLYAGPDPIVLDGTGSYDPDNSGPLGYTWRQISGPPVIIIDANTATPTIGLQTGVGRGGLPTIGGFNQTGEIQECEFELVVNDGELISLPDTVKVIIVSDFGVSKLYQLNPPFDPCRPTLVGFAGVGGCQNCGPWTFWSSVVWYRKVNFITCERFHASIYENVGDMFIVYLSSQAPDYRQSIQTFGHSAGGEPAIDVAIYLNETYADRRYAVNHVTLIDSAGYCQDYSGSIERFLASAVDAEQCWIDNYSSTLPGAYGQKMDFGFQANALNVWFDRTMDDSFTVKQNHNLSHKWYRESLSVADMGEFNSGVVAGAYWSVVGPGKNLQLASTPGVETYKFTWYGDELSGYMDFYDEPNHPGRLPEPVTLVGPEDGAIVDVNGAVFSCEESENAVGYQLLFGPDPYRVMDYHVVSDTPSPPVGIISEFPFEKTRWTVRAYDSFGSTIHADPHCINAVVVSPPMTLPHVLYVHKSDIEAADSFQSLLVDYGCSATLTGLADVATTPLDSYDLIIVGNDTGFTTTWGNTESVAAIEGSGKPVLGLGEGGYAFFGKLGLEIGYPNGGHASRDSITVVDPNNPLFNVPYPIDVPEDRVLQLYTESNNVGLYLWPVPETVTVLGAEGNNSSYYPLALEHDRYVLWGFTESPQNMTDVGKRLFINVVIRTANLAWEG